MRKHRILLLLVFLLFAALGLSCKKDSSAPLVNNPPVTTPSGNVANFELIKIPGSNAKAGIRGWPTQFYCTNIGPYLHLVNIAAKSSIIYKYRGGTGADAWLEFIPEPTLLNSFIPSSPNDEDPDEMSFFWCNGDPNFDYEYGLANLGNGSPPYKYQLSGKNDDDNQPIKFTSVYPQFSGTAKVWGVSGNRIWFEGSNPSMFDLVHETPPGQNIIDGFFDPDNNKIWCASDQMLFQPDLITDDHKAWDMAPLGSGYITTITKAKGTIYIQYGKYVLKANENQLEVIRVFSQTSSGMFQWASIASSGEILFANDGTFYDAGTNTWKSFVGSGLNLSVDEELKFKRLLNFLRAGYPITATRGTGSVYLLADDELLKIDPKF